MSRKLRPRPPVTATPLVVSDLTSFDLIGLTGRQLRDLLAVHREVPRAIVGHRVLVRADEVLRLVDRLARDGESVPTTEEDQPADADAVLAKLGRRRTA